MKQFHVLVMSLLLSMLALTTNSLAFDVEYVGIDVNINDDLTANVSVTITPKEPINHFEWTLFYRISDLKYSANFPMSCSLRTTDVSIISCDLSQNKTFRSFEIGFKTNEFVKMFNATVYSYFSDFIFPFKVSRLATMVKLPEGFTFSDTTAIIPQPRRIGSDGKRIFAYWSYESLDKDFALRISFFFETPKPIRNSSPYLVVTLVILVFVVIIVLFYLFYYRKRQFKIALSVIDKEEKKVIEILDSEGKPITQKKIVELTGYSKAKVSRIISSLHERKIIDVERRGRTNLVRLKPLYRGISRK